MVALVRVHAKHSVHVKCLHFKASRVWLHKFMKRFVFSLQQHTSITQKLLSDFEEK